MPVPDDLGAPIPIIEESVTIGKTVVQTDAVRVRTFVDEHSVMVEDTLRREGLTTIISLVEERVVVEKRLFVVEEVHVTRARTQEHVAIPVTLRAMRAEVERASDTQSTGSTTND